MTEMELNMPCFERVNCKNWAFSGFEIDLGPEIDVGPQIDLDPEIKIIYFWPGPYGVCGYTTFETQPIVNSE